MSISSAAAVLLTIAYADQFNFPLTKDEIRQRLIRKTGKNDLNKSLSFLNKINLIKPHGQFWKLNNSGAESKIRLEREKNSQKKWLEINELLRVISWIPWVEGVAVTGSLAVNNATANDDIDLMIVVAPRRLWLSRILVSLSSLWNGKRRTWKGNEENSWCFNLWLDDKHLKLPYKKRNLYSAHEVCQAKWILDKTGVKKKFYQANYWVKKLLPSYFISNYKNTIKHSEVGGDRYQSAPILRFVGRRLLDLLNLLIFIPQYSYMYPHMSREKVSLSSAYFHPRSSRGQVYQGWRRSLSRLSGHKRRLVLVTGVFDLFHQEHQNFLRKAKAEGDVLVVGVETDKRVRKDKGSNRPINDQQKRLQQLQLFPVVDLAFVLPEKFSTTEEHLSLLKLVKPHILAVSSHTPYLEEKRWLMKQVGGEVRVVYQQHADTSTTQILARK